LRLNDVKRKTCTRHPSNYAELRVGMLGMLGMMLAQRRVTMEAMRRVLHPQVEFQDTG